MTTPPTGSRGAERVAVEAFVIVRGDRGEEMVFRTRDISEQGLFLFTKVARAYPFKVGSTLALEIYDYEDSFTCKVIVIRVVEPGSPEADSYPTGFGVRIIECSDENREKLVALMQRVRAGEAPY